MTHTQANEPGFVLAPCPFCGGEAEILGTLDTTIRCVDDQCISRGAFNFYCHREDAISAWNHRASSAPIVPAPAYGVKEALKDTLDFFTYENPQRPGVFFTGVIGNCDVTEETRKARELLANDALSSAPVEEADAKAGEPLAFLVHNPIVTNIVRERESLFPASRENDAREFAKLLRADCTPLYATPPAPTIPSEPEAKGEAGAGPVGGGVAFEFDRYIDGTLMAEGVKIERQTTLEKASMRAAQIASRGPNGEVPVLVLRSPLYAAFVDQPSEVERLTRERDANARNVDLTANLFEAAERRAKTAEAALTETRERLGKQEEHTFRIVAENDKLRELADAAEELFTVSNLRGETAYLDPCDDPGLWTSRRNEAWNALEEAIAARAALSTQESSAALAGDGKEVVR